MTAVVHHGDFSAPLPTLSVSGRDQLVRHELAQRKDPADGATAGSLLVFDLNNIRWLTGFTGSAGTLVIHPDEMVLITDGRYGEQARHQLNAAGASARVVVGSSATALREALERTLQPTGAVAVDPSEVTHAQYQTIRWQTTAKLIAASVHADARFMRAISAGDLRRRRCCTTPDTAISFAVVCERMV